MDCWFSLPFVKAKWGRCLFAKQKGGNYREDAFLYFVKPMWSLQDTSSDVEEHSGPLNINGVRGISCLKCTFDEICQMEVFLPNSSLDALRESLPSVVHSYTHDT